MRDEHFMNQSAFIMIATNEIKIHLFIVSIRWHSLAFIYSMMSYLLLMQNMTVSPTGNTRVA